LRVAVVITASVQSAAKDATALRTAAAVKTAFPLKSVVSRKFRDPVTEVILIVKPFA
jgi:hypothetical protein